MGRRASGGECVMKINCIYIQNPLKKLNKRVCFFFEGKNQE